MQNSTIKTFVRRNARCSKTQKQLYQRLYPKYCIKLSDEKLDFEKLFENTNETIIEIGFGSGEATAQIAFKNPNKNYLGIEVFQTGVARLLAKIEKNSIENIRIIEDDAMQVLDNMISDFSVSAFHIFFPDPWQKKRHHKRRIMQAEKIDLMCKKLTLGGYIYFVTDWKEYADSSLVEFEKVSTLKNCYASFAPKQIWRPETNFEKKAILAKRNIYELIYKKILKNFS